MLIRFGLGGQLSGSVGGVVAGHNKGGQYLRNRSIPTNPNSTRQQQQRTGLATAAQAWKLLTTEQRAAWEGYAAQTPLVNRLGETITVSGFNMYVRTNGYRAGLALALISDAPSTPGQSTLGLIADPPIAYSVATGITFTTASSDATGTNAAIVQYGPSLSPGINFYKGPYSVLARNITNTATGFTVAPAGIGAGRYGEPEAGERRPFRVRSMDAAGRLSNTVDYIATVVA